MIDYLQPNFYRFNRDSIALVNWVKGRVKTANSILDLGAGCGVIGLELARHYHPKKLTLLELQEDFRPYLEENVKIFAPKETQAEIVISQFSAWTPTHLYDLVVCNPPYYLSDSGQPSKDMRRRKARSFIVDDWEVLVKTITEKMKAEGQAALVLKDKVKLEGAFLNAVKNQKLKFKMEKILDLVLIELCPQSL